MLLVICFDDYSFCLHKYSLILEEGSILPFIGFMDPFLPIRFMIIYIVTGANLDSVVQNLTKLLAYVTLKFLSWNMANTLIFFIYKNVGSFCIANCKIYSHFCSENTNVFENTLATTVNEFVIFELVKLIILWTTKPRMWYF